MKATPDEIKKALKCYQVADSCLDCPYNSILNQKKYRFLRLDGD